MKTTNKAHLMQLIMLFSMLIPFQHSFAVQKTSGKDFLNRVIKYDTNNIKSYGRIVTSFVNYSMENSEQNIVKFTDKHILFCGSGELYEYESESSEYNKDGSWNKSNSKIDSKDKVVPIGLEKTEQHWLKFGGLSGLYQDMQAKCSTANTKNPRIEIPIVRSESAVSHAILDTYLNDGKWRHIWFKEQKIYKSQMKDSSGNPLVLSGETMYDYKFVEPRNYSMARYTVDCKQDALAISQLIEYKANGEVLKSESVDLNRLRLGSVIPSSIGEAIHKFVCGL
jgi:hypothetical protein